MYRYCKEKSLLVLKSLSCMDPFPLKKQTQGHQKEIYINNDGWKEKPQKSHYLIFHKLYVTARVWLFNIVLEFIPFYH